MPADTISKERLRAMAAHADTVDDGGGQISVSRSAQRNGANDSFDQTGDVNDSLRSFISSIVNVVFSIASLKDIDSSILEAFISDPSYRVLYIATSFHQNGKQTLTITDNIQSLASNNGIVILIKHSSQLTLESPLQEQIQTISLPSSSPYDNMHSLVQLALQPYFDLYTSERSKAFNSSEDSGKVIPSTKKKLSELEYSFLHLQEKVAVPSVFLDIHPKIQELIRKGVDNEETLITAIGQDSALKDSALLNTLQEYVNSWTMSIKRCCQLAQNPSMGSLMHEINFWTSLEAVLENIEEQIQSPEIKLNFLLLRLSKRFHAAISFSSETGLKETYDMVHDYNQLMKDFPLSNFLVAQDFTSLQEAVNAIFSHINRKFRSSNYPVKRSIDLMETFCSEFTNKVREIAHGRRLMTIPFNNYLKVIGDCERCFLLWENNIKEFTSLARDLTRKRGEKFIFIKIKPLHEPLQRRLTHLKELREVHEKFENTLVSCSNITEHVLSMNGEQFLTELRRALDQFQNIDILDTSEEGSRILADTEEQYSIRISQTEQFITERLRTMLRQAANPKAMFAIFSTFNKLFVRSRIREAVKEYQKVLLDDFESKMNSINTKIRNLSSSPNYSYLRIGRTFTSEIIICQQLIHQIDKLREKIENVLGPSWESYQGGGILNSALTGARAQLKPEILFEKWLEQANNKKPKATGIILYISRDLQNASKFKLNVNFDKYLEDFSYEAITLKSIGFPLTHTLMNRAKEAQRLYPYVVSLRGSIGRIVSSEELISRYTFLVELVQAEARECRELARKGSVVHWENYLHSSDVAPGYIFDETSIDQKESRHHQYIRNLARSSKELFSKCRRLVSIYDAIMIALDEIMRCSYIKEAFQEQICQIQHKVVEIQALSTSLSTKFVDEINHRLGEILGARLQEMIQEWILFVERSDSGNNNVPSITAFEIEKVSHVINFKDQVFEARPPVETSIENLYSSLQRVIDVIANQKKVTSNIRNTDTSDDNLPVLDFPREVADSISQASQRIDEIIVRLYNSIDQWKKFEGLWLLKPDQFFAILDKDFVKWESALLEIKDDRLAVEQLADSVNIAFSIIQQEQSRRLLLSKYESWISGLLKAFVKVMQPEMERSFIDVRHAKEILQSNYTLSVRSWSTCVMVAEVFKVESQVDQWRENLRSYKHLSRETKRLNEELPDNWIFFETIWPHFEALESIYKKCKDFIKANNNALKSFLDDESRRVEKQISVLAEEWQNNADIRSHISASSALPFLDKISAQIENLHESASYILGSRQALGLPELNLVILSAIQEECNEFRDLWDLLFKLQAELTKLKNRNWAETPITEIRSELSRIAEMVKDLPTKFRQYELIENFNDELVDLCKTTSLLTDLKSGIMKDRHWKLFFNKFNLQNHQIRSMRLSDLWDLDLNKNRKDVRDIITQAQGESALEEYISEIKGFWSTHKFDLVITRQRYRLVRNWEEIMKQVSEHLNSLQAMKLSPFYANFDDDVTSWLQKLEKAFKVSQLWADVQRQWLYLSGIFLSDTTIQQLVPAEATKFASINIEFTGIMDLAKRNVFTLNTILQPNTQTLIERISDALKRIHKSLGSFLEKERQSYARLYFLGDESLLELVGNPSNITIINTHLRKVFPAIASVILDDSNSIIQCLISFEGENIPLVYPVNVSSSFSKWIKELEKSIKFTLRQSFVDSLTHFTESFKLSELPSGDKLFGWISVFPFQCLSLSVKVTWVRFMEEVVSSDSKSRTSKYNTMVKFYGSMVDSLTKALLISEDKVQILKTEALLTEVIFLNNLLRTLQSMKPNLTLFSEDWLNCQRYYFEEQSQIIKVKIMHSEFEYGFEYLGIYRPLVQTQLTTKCFLILSEALRQGLGGSPFGPAGTGKTETVKALGNSLGRLTLVFNCDSNFDYQSLFRILTGLCQIGAWGCFDEFNRLEGNILSAISQQVQEIQRKLINQKTNDTANVESTDQNRGLRRVHHDTGIFITMNPEYKGRTVLPANLKMLFRAIAMTKPDSFDIAAVMLYTKGFTQSVQLAQKVIPFFEECRNKLSSQLHYDFELRSMKAFLDKAGSIKRRIGGHSEIKEEEIMLSAIDETISPKLVDADFAIFSEIKRKFFTTSHPEISSEVMEYLKKVCHEGNYVVSDQFLRKLYELYVFITQYQGIMVIGPTFSGKSTVRNLLASVFSLLQHKQVVQYFIEPKSWDVQNLFGRYDQYTREWVDGSFTTILRRLNQQKSDSDGKMFWIVFDGDIDPEWAENMNSLLDDNKFLSLPTGERILLPTNVRIIFETDNLVNTTPATVTRCAMIWFSPGLVAFDMFFSRECDKLLNLLKGSDIPLREAAANELGQWFRNKRLISIIKELLYDSKFEKEWIQASPTHSALVIFLRLMNSHLKRFIDKASTESLDLNSSHLNSPIIRSILSLSLTWAFMSLLKNRKPEFHELLNRKLTEIQLLDIQNANLNLLEYDIDLDTGNWVEFTTAPTSVIDPQGLKDMKLMIETPETRRYKNFIDLFMAQRESLILCGPAGSGKTTMILDLLRSKPSVDVVLVNFSSETSSKSLLQVMEQYCIYTDHLSTKRLVPARSGRSLVFFCDEINLPKPDKFGVQNVISFLREMIEFNGFWNGSERVELENIQFLGALNPASYIGRTALPMRFLSRVATLHVDLPEPQTLIRIYTTLFSAVLALYPGLKQLSSSTAEASVSLYLECKDHFGSRDLSSYTFSPRELSRWVRGLFNNMEQMEKPSVEMVIYLWFSEARHIFRDRLVTDDDKQWFDEILLNLASTIFDVDDATIFFSTDKVLSAWTTTTLGKVDRMELRQILMQRTRLYSEETSDVQPIIFDEFLDHMLCVDRILRQKQGHMVLFGDNGIGKSTICKFVCWLNAVKIFQISPHKSYRLRDFESDLKKMILKCTCENEVICFLLFDSQILEPSFMERMNTLLANSEIPGLFEPEELQTILSQFKDRRKSSNIEINDDDLYNQFCSQISSNLHVILCIGTTKGGRKINLDQSPALYNRCAIDWIGKWSELSLSEIAFEKLASLEVPDESFKAKDELHNEHQIISRLMVKLYLSTLETKTSNQLSLPHFLDFCTLVVQKFNVDFTSLKKTHLHAMKGLQRLEEAKDNIDELRNELRASQQELDEKKKIANEKLQEMIVKQREAEEREKASRELRIEISQQEEQIKVRQEKVYNDLEQAMPAIAAAKNSVSNIKKQHLSEVRSMQNPPEAIRMTMEAVCYLLGTPATSWRAIQQIIRRDDFISNIINFNGESISHDRRVEMEKLYLFNPNFNVEIAERASKACGPLLEWVLAIIKYSGTLEMVLPLRQEIELLEQRADITKKEGQEVSTKISDLNATIATYNEEYADLIAKVQKIKDSSETVRSKISKSEKLFADLSLERERWLVTESTFEKRKPEILGNSVIISAVSVFTSALGEQERLDQLKSFKCIFDSFELNYSKDLDCFERCCPAKSRREWADAGLNLDNVSMQNAYYALSSRLPPLLVDPNGNVVSFLKNYIPKIKSCSFMDPNCLKTLESSMRFGNTLLIEDAHYMDPVILKVLRKDLSNVGGRQVLQLGSTQVDYSPSFRLFLSTSDSSFTLNSFCWGRVSLVNCVGSLSRLKNKILDESIHIVRPQMHEQVLETHRAQEIITTQIQLLEKSLLDILSSESDLLESVKLEQSLQSLKHEAVVLEQKRAESMALEQELTQIETELDAFASFACDAFKILQSLTKINAFYQFTLAKFRMQYERVVRSYSGDSSDQGLLIKELLRDVLKLAKISLSGEDFLAFSFYLCSIYEGNSLPKIDGFFSHNISLFPNTEAETDTGNAICDSLDNLFWKIESGSSSVISGFSEYARNIASLSMDRGLSEDLQLIIEKSRKDIPICLCMPADQDVSMKVEEYAKKAGRMIMSVAAGTSESFDHFEEVWPAARREGNWILVKNVHFDVTWVQYLEKCAASIDAHDDFRLFFSIERTIAPPTALLQSCQIMFFEDSDNFKETLNDSLSLLFPSTNQRVTPAEKAKVLLVLAWLHSDIRELAMFAPNLLSRRYSINDSDLRFAMNIITEWFNLVAAGRTNIAPKLIPWSGIRYTLSLMVYGAQVDVASDKKTIDDNIELVMNERAFETDKPLIVSQARNIQLSLPSTNRIGDFLAWARNLPLDAHESWNLLPDEVRAKLEKENGDKVLEIAQSLKNERQIDVQ